MVILEGEAAFLEGEWAELLVSLSHQYLSPKPKSPKHRASTWNLIPEQDMVDKGLSHFSISALKQIGNWYSYYANYTRQGLCNKIIYAKVCHCRHYTNTNVHHTFNFRNQLFKNSMICPLICVIALIPLLFITGLLQSVASPITTTGRRQRSKKCTTLRLFKLWPINHQKIINFIAS